MLLGPARSLQFAGLNEACIKMILTEWERGKWGGRGESKERRERVLGGERRKKHLAGRKFYNKDISKASLQLLLFPFLRKTKFLTGNIKSRQSIET